MAVNIMSKNKRMFKYTGMAGIIAVLFLYLLLSLAFIGCSSQDGSIKKNINYDDYFIIWAHSDIQPREVSEREYYEKAIDDINRNVPNIKIALVITFK